MTEPRPRDDRPLLPEQTRDDEDDRDTRRAPDGADAERDRWLQDQRPPHHGD